MHMKRFLTLALSALLAAGLLTACGGTSDGSADTAEVSLSSFYAGLAEEYGWTEDAASSGEEDILMMDVEGDLLESYYPGLADVATEQLIAKAPMMSAVVNEIVLAQCATEEDAAAAASIPVSYTHLDVYKRQVHAYPDSIGQVVVKVRICPDQVLEVTVRDHGRGIPDVEKARQPMFTTGGEERSGMGFTIMESFMDRLVVRSTPGRGTTVVMRKRLAPRLKSGT